MHRAMTGLYPILVVSLACSVSAFLYSPGMVPFPASTTLRRTSTVVASTSFRRFLCGVASATPLRMTSEHFDYLVIGGGSGGVASARRASTYDAKVNLRRC